MLRAKDAPEETSKFLGHGVCDNISKSCQLTNFSRDKHKIYEESINMLRQVGCNPADIRGIGISVAKLDLEEKRASNNSSILKFMKPAPKQTIKNNSHAENIKNDSKPCNFSKIINNDLSSDAEDRGLNAEVCGLNAEDGCPNSDGGGPNTDVEGLDAETRYSDTENGGLNAKVGGLDAEASDPKDDAGGLHSEVAEAGSMNAVDGSLNAEDEVLNAEVNGVSSENGGLDAEVLASLPDHIRQEVLRDYGKHAMAAHRSEGNSSAIMTRRKSSSQTNTKPSTSYDANNQSQSNAKKVSKENENKTYKDDLMNVSISQIDPDILEQMPEDIRQELCKPALSKEDKESLHIDHKDIKDDDNVSLENLPKDLSEPGPSHAVRNVKKEERDDAASELDPSILEHLPEDIRREICHHFNLDKGSSVTTRKQSKLQSQGNALENLGKISPTKKVPYVGKRRGRPPKNATSTNSKNIHKTSLPKKKVPTKSSPQITPTSSPQKTPKSSPLKEYDPNIMETEDEDSNDYDNGHNEEYIPPPPTFCGKSELQDIRPLIKGWLQSTSEPVEEDIQMMVHFLQGLIETQRLDVVTIIIRCIFRNISRLNFSANQWKLAYEDIITKIQTTMKSAYGHNLYIDNHFEIPNVVTD